MRNHPPTPTDAAPLTRTALLLRLALIGGITVSVVVAFAAVAGWLSPGRLTPTTLIDTFEQVNGPQPGFRRNHAKGVCIAGWFEGNGAATQWSTAHVFDRVRTPVSGRFALAGGQPYAADAERTVRSMALRFSLADGEEWRTGMNNIPLFVVRTPADFEAQLVASRPDPGTGKPDPAAMKAFIDAHPETARAIAAIKAHAVSSGFANESYSGLNAFVLVDARGKRTTVRWALQPVQVVAAESAESAAAKDKNFLFDALIGDVGKSPLQWRLIITFAGAGDRSDDATVAWPADRAQVDAGTLTIDQVAGEEAGNCRDLNFDPLVLPAGIEGSDDPLLSARSAAYAQSFTRRAGEPKSTPAVTTPAAEAKP